MKLLGIESSCDETCAAVVRDGREILSNVVASQVETHALYGGVVPEIASRAHTEAIFRVTKAALNDAGCTLSDIDAVAVTAAPGLIGALLVGVNFAKALAYGAGKPLIPVHHIRGHIAANYAYFNGAEGRPFLAPPFAALVVSGGHTSLVAVKDYTDFSIIGATRDDAAGESFDKVARLIGFPYPGGAKMDAAACGGNPAAYLFPDTNVKNHPYDFSFSGLKTCAVNIIHHAAQTGAAVDPADMAASFTDAVVGAMTARVDLLFSDPGYDFDRFVLAGGVAANSHLRKALETVCKAHQKAFFVPPPKLCGDNGVMIACQGYYEYLARKDSSSPAADASRDHSLSLNACATRDISEAFS